MNEIQNIIKEQFDQLPQVIRDTILSSNWQEKIRKIVKTNNLLIDQGAAIENLVLITMLGIEIPEDFVKNAKEYAKVNEEQAQNISAQVEQEIFGDIRKKLIETTDAVGTIGEIEQATNELDKVAAAIEKEARNTPTPSTKPSLKEKIPANYFDKNYTAPPTQVEKSPEPIIIEPQQIEAATDEIPVAETKDEIEIAPIELNESNIDSVSPEISTEDVQIEAPKEDPYREEIEPEDIKKPVSAATIPKTEKPIFTPMPKNLSETPEVTENNPITAKVDPYREPIE